MATATKQAPKDLRDNYKLSLKISKKGAVQLDGLRRFPVTLYADEWEAVLLRADAIKKFIASNKNNPLMKTKEEAGEDNGDRTEI